MQDNSISENKDKKDIYNLDIHPLVERIFLVCNQTQVPAFMIFQDDKDEFRTSMASFDGSAEKMMLSYLINSIKDSEKPQGNELDELINVMITNAQKNGHSSVFLDAMGIPRGSKA